MAPHETVLASECVALPLIPTEDQVDFCIDLPISLQCLGGAKTLLNLLKSDLLRKNVANFEEDLIEKMLHYIPDDCCVSSRHLLQKLASAIQHLDTTQIPNDLRDVLEEGDCVKLYVFVPIFLVYDESSHMQPSHTYLVQVHIRLR